VACDLPIKKFVHVLSHTCELTLSDSAGTEVIACVGGCALA
jgi:hypothetical protein